MLVAIFPPESKDDSLPWLLYKSFFYGKQLPHTVYVLHCALVKIQTEGLSHCKITGEGGIIENIRNLTSTYGRGKITMVALNCIKNSLSSLHIF